MKICVFLLLISNLIPNYYASQLPNVNIRITSAHQNYSSPLRLKRNNRNFRIHIHYDESFKTMENGIEFKKQVIGPAVQFWEEALVLKVSMNPPVLIDKECSSSFRFLYINDYRIKICKDQCLYKQKCSDAIIPEQFLKRCYVDSTLDGYSTFGENGKGAENADLIIIVAHQSQLCQRHTVASSSTCYLEHITDRPVMGMLNICPNKINFQANLNLAISTIKHEIVHILGFNSVLFPFYRDSYGIPLTSRDSNGYPNIGIKNIGSNWYYKYSDQIVIEKKVPAMYRTGYENKTLHFLITPNVKREVRSHFNCPSLEGLVLEDYGSAGNALSHFERRIFQNEIMTASSGKQAYVSRFTMALLEDTGWYYPNYDKADPFIFAKNAGCDFVYQTCYEYIKTRIARHESIYPYCNASSNSVKCSDDLTYISHCNLHKNEQSNVPYKFRYFDDANLVSSDVYSEYCPYYKEYVRKFRNVQVSNGICTDQKNNLLKDTKYDILTEDYGPSSICLKLDERTIIQSCKISLYDPYISAVCYQYKCSVFHRLVIIVGNLEYQCTYDGQIIETQSKTINSITKGRIVCPRCNLLCPMPICSIYWKVLPLECSGSNGRCHNETTLNFTCSGFQKDFTFSLIICLLLIIFFLHFFE